MILEIISLTLLIAIITIFARRYFGSAKQRFQQSDFRFKIRIHHGYIGLILTLLSLPFLIKPLFIIGVALLISDILHHFLILPIWVGETEFP